jgi:hypothetical protein
MQLITALSALFVLTMASAAVIPPAEAQKKVQALISSNTTTPTSVLKELWSALPSISVAKAVGTYHGGLFTKDGKPDPINWWGKQIVSETTVNPLLSTPPKNATVRFDAAGKEIVFAYPRASIAQARNVEHEGVVSATIIYNKIPLLDYFRVVKEGDAATGAGLVLLGKSDIQGKEASPAYFHLTRVNGQVVDLKYPNP